MSGFAYRTGEPVLFDVDLEIPAGANVAVVGETGSGKTTTAMLICRLADPSSGRITVGGIDLREVSASSRAAAIRLVPQDGFLFDTTIEENVRRGRPDATTDEVRAAFDDLGLGWWVDRLTDGLATEVGERGESLSVGERQLVALACGPARRCRAARPRRGHERGRRRDRARAGRRAGPGCRRAARRSRVAHRLSTAEHADLVVVFDGGSDRRARPPRRADRRSVGVTPTSMPPGSETPGKWAEFNPSRGRSA